MCKTLFTLLALVLIPLSASGCTRQEQAQAEPFWDAVVNADLIVSGNVTDKRYDIITHQTGNFTGKHAYKIFTLSVEKVIKGDPTTKEVLIRVPGGPIGQLYQGPPEWYFSISDQLLVSLHREEGNVDTVSSPELVWILGPTRITQPDLPVVIGRVIKIMKANNIPIALPESEWPPLPTGSIKRPEKETLPKFRTKGIGLINNLKETI